MGYWRTQGQACCTKMALELLLYFSAFVGHLSFHFSRQPSYLVCMFLCHLTISPFQYPAYTPLSHLLLLPAQGPAPRSSLALSSHLPHQLFSPSPSNSTNISYLKAFAFLFLLPGMFLAEMSTCLIHSLHPDLCQNHHRCRASFLWKMCHSQHVLFYFSSWDLFLLDGLCS